MLLEWHTHCYTFILIETSNTQLEFIPINATSVKMHWTRVTKSSFGSYRVIVEKLIHADNVEEYALVEDKSELILTDLGMIIFVYNTAHFHHTFEMIIYTILLTSLHIRNDHICNTAHFHHTFEMIIYTILLTFFTHSK